MYSPGSLKVAVVEALPVNAEPSGPLNSAFSTCGRSFSKVTEPGPRNMLQPTVTEGPRPPRPAGAAGPVFASWVTQTVSGRGLGIVSVSEMVWPRGPFTNGPVSANEMNAGLSMLASTNGETSHSVPISSGMAVVFSLATIVQVKRFSPKFLGTTMVNTPHWRPARKWVGWPISG